MKKQSLALHFYKSVSLDLREEFQSVQSHNSTEKCGEYDEGAVCTLSFSLLISLEIFGTRLNRIGVENNWPFAIGRREISYK